MKRLEYWFWVFVIFSGTITAFSIQLGWFRVTHEFLVYGFFVFVALLGVWYWLDWKREDKRVRAC